MKEKQNESFETSQKDNTVPVRKSTLILLFCLCGVLAAGTGVGIYRSYRSQDTYRNWISWRKLSSRTTIRMWTKTT